MSLTSWFLVSSSGTRHRLPREMIFVGREECELMLQSRSVDKQHAVINYDPATDEHLVKDLGSLNGTFVNDLRIPDQTYITLKMSDVIRFGYDAHVYILEKSQHKVPEEALKHEKYTSQFQIGLRAHETRKREQAELKTRNTESSGSKPDKAELKTLTDTPVHKPTPLYGQPSWWGEDDEPGGQDSDGRRPNDDHTENTKENSRHTPEVKQSPPESKEDQDKSIYSYRREPSYFEIPTKDFSQLKTVRTEDQEIPTKDTNATATPTPPVVQSHASFTIEFDDCTPGKMKIKDHVTKFSFRQRKNPSKEATATPTEVMSVENKVTDWLAQNNVSMRSSRSDNLCSTKGDMSTDDKHHHDGQSDSDSEGPVNDDKGSLISQPPTGSETLSQQGLLSEFVMSQPFISPENEEPTGAKPDHQQAFIIEFFDNNPRKKQAQSLNMSPPDSLKSKPDKRKVTSQVESAGSNTHTQRLTIPLNDSGNFQRGGSLRREKTDIRMSASNFSSRSASSKPFGSLGRNSRLARDFTALLKASKSNSSDTSPAHSHSPDINLTCTPYPTHQAVPSKPSHMSHAQQDTEAKSPKGPKHEEEDSLSDAGTYTIEADGPDKDLEEARSRIDQVFGVGECSEHSSQPSGAAAAYKPVVLEQRQGQDSLADREFRPSVLSHNPANLRDLSMGPAQMRSVDLVNSGGPKWVSRWASLADSYSNSGHVSGLCNIPAQKERVDGGGQIIHQAMLNQNSDTTESEIGQSHRARRVLPQVPSKEKTETTLPSILTQQSYLTYEAVERREVLRTQDDINKLRVQEDLDPDSLSDTSKSDDGSMEQCRKYSAKQETVVKLGKTGRDKGSPQKFSTATLTRPGKPNSSAPNLEFQDKESKEVSVSLVRQESFTKDRPSDDVYVTRLPQITSHLSTREGDPTHSLQGMYSQDTQSYLKDTEAALAALESKLQGRRQGQQLAGSSYLLEDSLSGDSDVDTSSTVSQQSNRNAPSTTVKKPVVLSNNSRQKSPTSQHNQEPNQSQQSSQELFSDHRSFSAAAKDSKVEPSRSYQLQNSTGKHRVLDLSNDHQDSNKRYLPDTVSSDQEFSSKPSASRKISVPLKKDDSSKSLRSMVAKALGRSNSLSAPRPTRTSMLRRARLGEASDNESAETDRTSQNSDPNIPATKGAQESKKLSRLDLLALPRRRTGSFTTTSDTESSTRRTGFSNRSSESSSSVRKASVPPEAKTGTRRGTGPTGKQPIIRGRSSSAKYASSSRRRQKGLDYTSTSEEEYESNHNISKHKRSHNSAALQVLRAQAPSLTQPKPRAVHSEEECHSGDAFQNWTSHSAEIARLSQDLAKDLAILAREIHDVAGDAEPQTSTTKDSKTSARSISAHEELQHNVPVASPMYQKVRKLVSSSGEPACTINDEKSSLKQQSRNKEEVIFDNVVLNPVFQLSQAIRENTEQLMEKIKVLFHNKTEVWKEIEAKLNTSEYDPALNTSNKKITSILGDLRTIQKQLEVINIIIDPSGNQDLGKNFAAGSPSPLGMTTSRTSRD
ncbi:centrosomal protein of 170 kDa protein B [Chanos chanos]|uniref:Centrosomal protein of 170 kDa protein B n=1 Tax=Chanos chanos TaxID=29144 RepID=A0A6J2URV3_CHACN|nr:centrosomal protein of 170 kDa protein B [Chanos chanos]